MEFDISVIQIFSELICFWILEQAGFSGHNPNPVNHLACSKIYFIDPVIYFAYFKITRFVRANFD